MPANNSPIFILSPKIGLGNLTVANTNNDGTGTIVTLFTAGSNGSIVTAIRAMCRVSTAAAARINLFINDGSTSWLWSSVVTPVVTVSASVKPADYDFPLPMPMSLASGTVVPQAVIGNAFQGNGLILPSGYTLRAACTVADSWNVIAIGGDY